MPIRGAKTAIITPRSRRGAPRRLGARVKDKLESFLEKRVCDGTVRLSKARKAFRDWNAAFKRFDL